MSVVGLALLFIAPLAISARAQQFAPANLSYETLSQEDVSSYDFSRLSGQWWKGVARSVDRDLLGGDEQKIDAMQKIIFLASVYPGQARFHRSTYKLYNIYRFDRNERLRVMALAALFSSGDEDGMRLVAYHDDGFSYAPWEESPRLRRLTAAAVARHFGTPEIEVGSPMPIG